MNPELLKQAIAKKLKHTYQKAKVKAKRFREDLKRTELFEGEVDPKLLEKGRDKLEAKRRTIQGMKDEDFKEYSSGRKARNKLSEEAQDKLDNQHYDRQDEFARKLINTGWSKEELPDKLRALAERQNKRSLKAKSTANKAKAAAGSLALAGGGVYALSKALRNPKTQQAAVKATSSKIPASAKALIAGTGGAGVVGGVATVTKEKKEKKKSK